jgi:prepilin-type processing-associated H-X9-DG protein
VKSIGVFVCPSFTNAGNIGPVTTVVIASNGMQWPKTDGTHALSYGINDAYFNGAADSSYHVSELTPFGNNGSTVYMNQIAVPDKTVALLDYISNAGTGFGTGTGISADVTTPTSPNYRQVYRHTDMTDVVMCDGHVKSMPATLLADTHNIAWKTGSGTDAVYYWFTCADD